MSKSVRRKIRKGKYVDMFTLMEYKKAKKAGEGAEEAYRFMVSWVSQRVKRPEEHSNVIRYLINEVFLGNKGYQWRNYDKKFRRHQDGNPILPLGFKDGEVWLEVVNQGRKASEPQPRKPFSVPRSSETSAGRGKCFAFNDSKCNRGSRCHFRHSCKVCGANHAAKDCKLAGGGAAPTRGEAGGGVQ